jgi:hypothetical protein
VGTQWPLVTLPPARADLPNSFRTLKGHLTVAAVCCSPATRLLQGTVDPVYHAPVGAPRDRAACLWSAWTACVRAP